MLTLLHRELLAVRRIVFFTCTTGIFPTGRAVRRDWASWPEPWSPATSELIQLGAALRSQDAHNHMVNGKSPARHEHSAEIIHIFPASR